MTNLIVNIRQIKNSFKIILLTLSAFVLVMQPTLSLSAETKINGLPWYAVIKMKRWQQKDVKDEKSVYLMFDNHRYFIIKDGNNLIDQGKLSIAKKPMRINLHNQYGLGYFEFSKLGMNSFHVDGVIVKRFKTEKFSGNFVAINKPLVPPVAVDLYQAAKYGDLLAVKKYLKAGQAINGKSASKVPLIAAATHHHTRIVLFLLANKAKVDAKDEHGLTALAHAVQSGDIKAAHALIQAGAKVNLINKKGDSLLFSAFERNSLPMVKLLIKNGADINYLDKSGFTAIHRAMSVFSLGQSKIIERLAYTKYMVEKAGYDPKTKDQHGRTVLFYAANLGLEQTVKYLLSKGVNPYDKDKSGKDVFEYIKESEFKDKIRPVLLAAKKSA